MACGALGSIILGIGTIIGTGLGAEVGNVVGFRIYRFDNHRLQKALKEYQGELKMIELDKQGKKKDIKKKIEFKILVKKSFFINNIIKSKKS